MSAPLKALAVFAASFILVGLVFYVCSSRQGAYFFPGDGPVCTVAELSRIGPPTERVVATSTYLRGLSAGPLPVLTEEDLRQLEGQPLEVLAWSTRCLGFKVSETRAGVAIASGRVLFFSRWRRFYGIGVIGRSPPSNPAESVRLCGPS